MRRNSFAEAERQCEMSFSISGKWYHLYTSGKSTAVFIKDDEDFKFCMNLMARCAVEFTELVIVAFAIMNNHMHIVLSGDWQVIELFFVTYRRRLSRFLSSKYSEPVPMTFQMSEKEIPDLKTLRNTIVYVNRNGFVSNPNFTPFSYPWSTGVYYFNAMIQSEPLSALSIDCQRVLFRGRVPSGLEKSRIFDGSVTADSFCSIKFGMSLFRDAHHYFSLLSKGIESYSEIAVDIDEGEFLTDSELFTELVKILNENYAGAKLCTLSNAQKLDLARTLHFKYHSSNGQIKRILGISQYDINQLFKL